MSHPIPRALLLAWSALVCSAAPAADSVLATQLLGLDRELHAHEQSAHADARLHLFVGSSAPELRLRRVKLRIDELEPQTYEYAEPEWEAMAAGGLHPALSMALPPGAHRLRVELYARAHDAGPSDPRAVEWLDRSLTLAPGEHAVTLELTQERFARSGLLVHEAAELGAAWPRAAQFWLAADHPWRAARILSRQGGSGELLATSLAALSGTPASNPAALDAFNAALSGAAAGELQALTLIAERKPETESDWALRDHANLLLGYAQLRAGDGKSALDAFARVRSPGPHGNAALLGFGWAFLVQPTDSAARGAHASEVDRPAFATLIDARPLKAARDQDAREDRQLALQRALVPWTELIGRDPLDLDAQEGALAVAWALDQLGTGAQSHVYYERAAHQLETARARLDLALGHVSSGAAAQAIARGQRDAQNGWRAWLADLPYAEDTAYLKYLLDEPRWVAALDDYRDATLLLDEAEALRARIAALPPGSDQAGLDVRIEPLCTRAADMEHLARLAFEREATALLRARKQRTERYLVEARFAMARHFDSAPPPETEIVRSGLGAGS